MALITHADFVSWRPPRNDTSLSRALVTESLATTATMMFLLVSGELLLAGGTLVDLRVGNPVGGRNLISHPLLGKRRWPRAQTLYGVTDIGHVVDDFTRQVVRCAAMILLTRPDVLQLGAYD